MQQTDDYPINTATCPAYTFNNQRVCLLHYTSATIDGKVTINGALPVIIVSDTDISVTGTITSPPTNMSQGSCHIPVASTVGTDGGGGGGGGYGGTGGNGGAGASSPSTPGAAAVGMQSLEPLMLGYPGGKGADGSNGAIGGRAGYGGGALELSAQGTLTISGIISILLEADAVTIASGGGACALGGGGGEGGDDSALNNGSQGQTAQGCSPALGGGPPNDRGTGGKGGALTAATAGVNGAVAVVAAVRRDAFAFTRSRRPPSLKGRCSRRCRSCSELHPSPGIGLPVTRNCSPSTTTRSSPKVSSCAAGPRSGASVAGDEIVDQLACDRELRRDGR